MDHEKQLRQQLAKVLDWNEAHINFKAAVSDFPEELRAKVPTGMPHSAWQLLEHIRIALWDIVAFSRSARHKSPKWPEGYWPKAAAPPSSEAWDESAKEVGNLIEEMRELVTDPARDLFAPISHGSGQTLLRQVLLAADHNSYHLGQLVLVRKGLGVDVSS
jgi:hypothetical protein